MIKKSPAIQFQIKYSRNCHNPYRYNNYDSRHITIEDYLDNLYASRYSRRQARYVPVNMRQFRNNTNQCLLNDGVAIDNLDY